MIVFIVLLYFYSFDCCFLFWFLARNESAMIFYFFFFIVHHAYHLVIYFKSVAGIFLEKCMYCHFVYPCYGHLCVPHSHSFIHTHSPPITYHIVVYQCLTSLLVWYLLLSLVVSIFIGLFHQRWRDLFVFNCMSLEQ